MPVASKYSLTVIEDCCHACGSAYQGRQLGRFADAAFYSYEWSKPVVLGVGGSALINSPRCWPKCDGCMRKCWRLPLWMSPKSTSNICFATSFSITRFLG
jgi:dTDP-4-amino-4,6-dideoxygalactose transaminase